MRILTILTLTIIAVVPSVAQEVPMDYSYCGYHHSEATIPAAKVAAYVQPQEGDNAALIQQAIDYVSSMKPDRSSGLRGAVLLAEGTYELSTPLYIRASGVVLRGSGRGITTLRKTGYDRGALLYIEGTHAITVKDTLDIADAKAGTVTVSVEGHSKALTPTARITIWRPSTQEWIDHLGCASFGGGKRMGYWAWHPGDIDLRWHRRIVSMDGQQLTLDAPLTCAIDRQWGGAKAIVYDQPGIISESGLENMTLESDYDRTQAKDEDHCWDGVYIADAEDCWVRMVNFRHFAGSAVVVQKSAQQVTVEDCKSTEPVSEIGGYRRRTFLALGETTLFQRCYSEQGINDFAVGHTAPGPNAFVQCESYESLGPSGAISSWAPGLLFDIVNIDGNDICMKNWELEKFGAGWATANSTMWQSTAAGLFCYSPDSLNRNISHGCWGQIQGNGEYTQMNEHVRPYSLYEDQLKKRLGRDVTAQCRVMMRGTDASSSPTIEQAIRMAEEALQLRMTMQMWIDSAVMTAQTTAGKLKPFVPRREVTARDYQPHHYAVSNGWLTNDKTVLAGKKHRTPWWSGRILESFMPKAEAALTRFVPGQEGKGLTDRVDSVVAELQRNDIVVFSQHYGLWTDRRRDDHERIRRKDGDAWPPFFEQPFARSGKELAWDGMSKYDLTTLNKWYFARLQQFAKKTEATGMILKMQHYFQHNILEAGAHWVDCPWRTANNINGTPFLEPVNFTGDKRIFTAKLFYDIDNPTMRELHRQYIRQTLDAFKGQQNVMHSIGDEFTGPLHFVQFWLDVIAEWEQENGKVLVDLAVTKDVQDAILADPVRKNIVDVIDIEQWFYHNKGEYAPPGGVNMAPRQYMRKIRTGGARFEDVYRAVAEYRMQYPDKAVIYSAQKYPEMGWAAVMAGGSCAAIPVKDAAFLYELTMMTPQTPTTDGCYVLKGDRGMLVYNNAERYTIDLGTGRYILYTIDATSGKITRKNELTGSITIDEKGIYWLFGHF